MRERPDAVALESATGALTFGELQARSATIASTLREAGVGPGDRVAIWAHRTPSSVAAAFATMSLRAAYVPVDPTYPPARVQTILARAGPAAVLHDSGVDGPAPPAIDRGIDLHELSGNGDEPPAAEPRPDDVAYVVFTSGSTGVPKGVMVEHASLVNYVVFGASVVGRGGCGAPVFQSLAVDHAVTSLWLPLTVGRPVVLAPTLLDQELIFRQRADRYTFVKATPSHVRFFERFGRPDYRAATRILMFGGERLDPSLLERLGERVRGIRLINHYGPTEATVGCCWNEFELERVRQLPSVPIGRPIANSRAYVLDGDARPPEPGQRGELIIAGACVARGYLGDPDGTAARFIEESQLDARRSGRAYRTGDIVEVLDDGSLLYVGRVDDQIKVGGYRIELGELRRHALSADGVADAAFAVVDGDVETIEAFVVPDAADEPAPSIADDVKRRLGELLPPGLLPRRIHTVPRLEINSAGKVDVEATRRAVG